MIVFHVPSFFRGKQLVFGGVDGIFLGLRQLQRFFPIWSDPQEKKSQRSSHFRWTPLSNYIHFLESTGWNHLSFSSLRWRPATLIIPCTISQWWSVPTKKTHIESWSESGPRVYHRKKKRPVLSKILPSDHNQQIKLKFTKNQAVDLVFPLPIPPFFPKTDPTDHPGSITLWDHLGPPLEIGTTPGPSQLSKANQPQVTSHEDWGGLEKIILPKWVDEVKLVCWWLFLFSC